MLRDPFFNVTPAKAEASAGKFNEGQTFLFSEPEDTAGLNPKNFANVLFCQEGFRTVVSLFKRRVHLRHKGIVPVCSGFPAPEPRLYQSMNAYNPLGSNPLRPAKFICEVI